MNFYAESIAQVFAQVHGTENGLTSADAAKRIARYGRNVFARRNNKLEWLNVLASQFRSPLIAILIVAAVVSFFIGVISDVIVIGLTVLVNVIVGFSQEYRASISLAKLKELVKQTTLTLRDGHITRVRSEELVVGDLIMLEAGDRVSADARLMEAVELEINEATLTGESMPARKHTRKNSATATLAERSCMVYKGTIVSAGHGRAIIVATGQNTELGKIASLISTTDDQKTPLQKSFSRLSRKIGISVLVIVFFIFLFGFVRSAGDYETIELFQVAVALAVAAIPEGLPISFTVILAVGMQFILARRGLVRRLLSAETLGSVNVICTDKTGTLTEGKMQAVHLITKTQEFDREELGLLLDSESQTHRDALFGIRIGVLCNNAEIEHNPDGAVIYHGDNTESALLALGERVNMSKSALTQAMTRLAEIPFDSHKKFMATMHRVDHENVIYVKGAFESILPRLTRMEQDGRSIRLNKEHIEWFSQKEIFLTSRGLRVLALAYKICPDSRDRLEMSNVSELVLVGLVALEDPLRAEVKETVASAQSAGIRIIMITGDHERTAQAIGMELGLIKNENEVVNGSHLSAMKDDEISDIIKTKSVFARVNPADKIKIVQALQRQGDVVAMTGDGVNDGPALKAADIGVAMGSGTDTAKEIADLVLLDDRFSTIVSTVAEGRAIYQNIQKVLVYLLSFSLAEMALIIMSLIAGLPLALLSAQILWLNLAQDTLPAIALAFDRGESENMRDKPRNKFLPLIPRPLARLVIILIATSSIVLLSLFAYFYHRTGANVELTRTIVFVALGLLSLVSIYPIRSFRRALLRMRIWENFYLTLAVAFGIVMLVAAVYLPPLQNLLQTVPLPGIVWLGLCGVSGVYIVFIEIIKRITYAKQKISG